LCVCVVCVCVCEIMVKHRAKVPALLLHKNGKHTPLESYSGTEICASVLDQRRKKKRSRLKQN
jgi:hypothetical protein